MICGINHGTGMGTSSGPLSLPANGIAQGDLWTCRKPYPQAGDRGDNPCLTRAHAESDAAFPCSARDNSGKARLFPLSTAQLLSTSYRI